MSFSENPVLRAIFERRSIRQFTEEPVSREQVETLLHAGQWAPSGLNNQPWRFLVLTRCDPRLEKLEACTKYSHVLRRCQRLIAVFLDRETMYNEVKDHQGIGACVQNMLLAAHGLGLGTVWLGEILNQEAAVMDILGLDANRYALMACVAVGYPDQKGDSHRKDLNELLLEAW